MKNSLTRKAGSTFALLALLAAPALGTVGCAEEENRAEEAFEEMKDEVEDAREEIEDEIDDRS